MSTLFVKWNFYWIDSSQKHEKFWLCCKHMSNSLSFDRYQCVGQRVHLQSVRLVGGPRKSCALFSVDRLCGTASHLARSFCAVSNTTSDFLVVLCIQRRSCSVGLGYELGNFSLWRNCGAAQCSSNYRARACSNHNVAEEQPVQGLCLCFRAKTFPHKKQLFNSLVELKCVSINSRYSITS